MNIRIKIFFLIFALSTYITLQCKKISINPENIEGIITFVAGDVQLNGQDAIAGQTASINDTIITGNKSIAVIQFKDLALVTIQSNSSLTMAHLPISDIDKFEFSQEYGEIFSRVKKNTSFTVKTPTITASVRGTAFLIRQKRSVNEADCSVITGSVSIIKTKKDYKSNEVKENNTIDKSNSAEIILNAGYRSVASRDTLKTPVLLNDNQKKHLDRLCDIKFSGMAAPEAKTTVVTDNMPVIDKKLEKDIVDLDFPDNRQFHFDRSENDTLYIERLNAIKIKNRNKLDIIKFRDGKVVSGMIIERGLIYKIETPKGTIRVQADRIESQTITY